MAEDAGRGSGTERERLGAGLGFSMFLRSFLLQAVWNPRGMQNVGFCFSMLPLVGARRDNASGRRAFLTRHLGFFNSNPAMASYAIGAAASAELRGAPEEALDIKRSLGGPLGAAGDALFWGSLRPLAALVGVALTVVGRSWGPIALLVVYNVPHLYFRARGIAAGAARGAGAAAEVASPAFRRAVGLVRAACAFIAGLVLALTIAGGGEFDGSRAFIALAFLVLAYAALKLRIPATVVGLAAALGGIVLMVTGAGGGAS